MLMTTRLSTRFPRFSSGAGLHKQTGFSLVELMIAITLALLLLAALSQVFVNSSRSRNELESASMQIENGRFASRVMIDSFQHAGFLAEFNIENAMTGPTIPVTLPTSKPTACSTTLSDLQTDFPIYIQGYNNVDASTLASLGLGCISDVVDGSDVVVVRHTSVCVQGSTDCNDLAGAPYFQASLCNDINGLGSGDANNYYRLDTATANLNRRKRNCTDVAETRRFLVHIYYVANNDQAGDGIPTLKRAALGNGGFDILPLANGIEQLQIEYGMDSNDDGNPDTYVTDPDTFNACTGVGDPCSPQNWFNVVSVKFYLLTRNVSPSAGYNDIKTYNLGADSYGPFNDKFKRHVYQSAAKLVNPAERR